ncbi:Diphthine--ammonia ligase [Favolaschia claudopus]|uniref:Diphthine--ammonia ligase n=1 Tax=Favolaschia claudopus TaxID=2862362 RepID=A0AAW0EBP5_9AGAR
MKYVALLSGGKDSCYNLLHCKRNGHELVSAASLGPGPGKEEIDSYMYQTVGQDAIELVARALDVPLYRRVISGQALEQGSEYGARSHASGTTGDETEDMHALLSTVKAHHPEIEGVSVGAILSNYQRVRVEHVCRRLSLTPLCYLWQRDQGELMAEMVEAGMESILIKVAGIGLTTKHLGNTLAQMQPTFIKLNNLYGAHICGEGGEYETLTLDCPMFKQRIVLKEVETVVLSDSGFATVAYLRIKSAILQPKSDVADSSSITVPEMLDDPFTSVKDNVQSSIEESATIDQAHAPLQSLPLSMFEKPQSRKVGSWVAIASICSNAVGESPASLDEEVNQCFSILQDELARHSLELSDCTNINIFLSSMDLFSAVNTVYGMFFGTSPPARACVAVNLPAPHRVMLDCIAHTRTTERHALHVQSLSYWAPANIGPYSQAIMINKRVFISGQIGLIPHSLALPSSPSLGLQTALSLQHVERVTRAISTVSGGWQGHTQLALYWLANITDLGAVRQGHSVSEQKRVAPTLFLVVEHIPKNALVEKQVVLHTGRVSIPDEDGDLVQEDRIPAFKEGNVGVFHWEVSWLDDTDSSCVIICGRNGGDPNALMEDLLQEPGFNPVRTRTLSVRVCCVPSSREPSFSAVFDLLFDAAIPTTVIPCKSISSLGSDNWDYAICILTA